MKPSLLGSQEKKLLIIPCKFNSSNRAKGNGGIALMETEAKAITKSLYLKTFLMSFLFSPKKKQCIKYTLRNKNSS